MSLFFKSKKFQNVTKMATTILLHSQKVTACVCLECTRLQRQTFVGSAMQSSSLPWWPLIVAALPSSKVSKEGHTALNPFLTTLHCLSHEKLHILFKQSKNQRFILQVHSNAKPGNFQPTLVSVQAFNTRVKQWRQSKVTEGRRLDCVYKATNQWITPPACIPFLCVSFHCFANQFNSAQHITAKAIVSASQKA